MFLASCINRTRTLRKTGPWTPEKNRTPRKFSRKTGPLVIFREKPDPSKFFEKNRTTSKISRISRNFTRLLLILTKNWSLVSNMTSAFINFDWKYSYWPKFGLNLGLIGPFLWYLAEWHESLHLCVIFGADFKNFINFAKFTPEIAFLGQI